MVGQSCALQLQHFYLISNAQSSHDDTNAHEQAVIIDCCLAGLPPHMGGGGGFGRGHHVPHDHHQPFRNRLANGSYYMDPEEIDSILRIQWKSLHSGSPYVEDYYYLVSQPACLQHV